MAVIDSIAAYADDLKSWRRHLHAHPELGFACHETAGFVCDRLRAFGISEIHTGIATSGLVALVEGREPGRTIGLRADMDALPMDEEGEIGHASKVAGRMHACGHDGHTAMLLGAAKYLAETRNFSGRVALIFQPAEEQGGGGREMCKAGIMDRFGIEEVYALHTAPSYEVGTFATRPGPIMAAVDEFRMEINGTGGHAAHPQHTRDPVAAALQLGQAVQTIVSRNVGPFDNVVVSLTQIHCGTTHNVVPSAAFLGGTIRSYLPDSRELARRRLREICDGTALAMQVEIGLEFPESLPPTVNDPEKIGVAARAAGDIVGSQNVRTDAEPRTGGEDFAYMLEQRPGAFVFIGQGKGPMPHHPRFDFNDDIAPIGASFFARLVERELPLG